MDDDRTQIYDELLIAADLAEETGNLFTATLMRRFSSVYLRASRYGNIRDPGFMTAHEYICRIVQHSSWVQSMEGVPATTNDLSELRLMQIAIKQQKFLHAAKVLKEISKPVARLQTSCISLLIDDGKVSLWQVFDAARLRFSLHPRQHNISILRAVEIFEYVTEDDVADAQSRFHKLELINPVEADILSGVIEFLPEIVAREHNVFPLAFADGRLTIAVADPMDIESIENIRFMLNCSVALKIATRTQIQRAIDQRYGVAINDDSTNVRYDWID
ncbi:MAG: hypothetical protein AB8B55_20140 [Mariniblastus sp.]